MSVGRAGDGRRFDAVLFDIDDTLYEVADLAKANWVAHAGALKQAGLDHAEVIRAYDRVRAGLRCRDALDATVAAVGAPVASAAVLAALVEGHVPATLPCRPGAVELVTDLHRAGVPVGAVTNGLTARQHAKIAALGLTGLFSVVLIAGGDGPLPAKPSPEPFRLAARALGTRPERVLVVGDRPDCDIAPALGLGMGAVRLVGGHYAPAAAHPGSLLDSDDVAAVWAAVRHLTGTAAGSTR